MTGANRGARLQERVLLPDAEILVALAFLASHSPDDYRERVNECRREVQEVCRRRALDELRPKVFRVLGLCVRAENALRKMTIPHDAVPSYPVQTVGDVEAFMRARDEWIRNHYGARLFTKIVLRDIRGRLKAHGLNY